MPSGNDPSHETAGALGSGNDFVAGVDPLSFGRSLAKVVAALTRQPNDVAEAVLRWQHPEHGLLTAGRFMPLVEETGLIHSIGEWVLASAVDQAQGWHALG